MLAAQIPALAPLLERLDQLAAPATLEMLTSALSQVDVTCHDVAEFVRFSERGYTRNLVQAGPWYHLLVLCWKNGQRSPIHDHAGSACGVRILRGTLTETRFAFAANGHIKAVDSREYQPGQVIGSVDTDMHQISNLQSGVADLVTLHVYSPPLLLMGTYSLFDTNRGYEPMFIAFDDAAGI